MLFQISLATLYIYCYMDYQEVDRYVNIAFQIILKQTETLTECSILLPGHKAERCFKLCCNI